MTGDVVVERGDCRGDERLAVPACGGDALAEGRAEPAASLCLRDDPPLIYTHSEDLDTDLC